jgi:methylmalonyl-CoA mutase N-terminal domain/subunit
MAATGEREGLTTDAGIEVKPFYGPGDVSAAYESDIGDPGRYPFTRGNFAGGYRDRLWTFRQ